MVSAAIFSAIRRCPALARDQSILPAVLLGCCSENPVAARHAFAVLADQATRSPSVVSQVRAEVGYGWGRGGISIRCHPSHVVANETVLQSVV